MGCGASAASSPPSSPPSAYPPPSSRADLARLCERSIELNDGRLLVRGVLHRAGVVNCNGRVYPISCLRREAERYARERVAARAAFGYLDHPDYDCDCDGFSTVCRRRASHLVLETEWQRDALVGTCLVLDDTEAGTRVRRAYLSGEVMGASSRGTATLMEREDGTVVVGNDFTLIAFDYVLEPSTPGAFLMPLGHRYGGLGHIKRCGGVGEKGSGLGGNDGGLRGEGLA